MFTSLVVRGGAANILWGYRSAVALTSWSIAKDKKTGTWTLRGAIDRIDAFQSRQRPLLFAAPRPGGHWAWPIVNLTIAGQHVIATLGPPEQ